MNRGMFGNSARDRKMVQEVAMAVMAAKARDREIEKLTMASSRKGLRYIN